jgi:hypothetical protein
MSAGRSAPNFDGLSPARRPLAAFLTRLMAASLIAICAWYPRRAPETLRTPIRVSEMDEAQPREFHEALLDARTFEELPGKWQAAIVAAEQNRPKLRLVERD